MAAITIKYVDDRPIFYPALSYYRNGVRVNKGDVIKVNEKELKYFLRQKNGKNNCFEQENKVKRPPRDEIKVESVEVD